MNIALSAKKLFMCIGEINDFFLIEAETADIAAELAARKRKAVLGTVAAAASVGIAVTTLWILRARRIAARVQGV